MYAKIDITSKRNYLAEARFVSPSDLAGKKMFTALSLVWCAVGTMGVLTPEMMAQRDLTSSSGLQYKSPAKAPQTVVALLPTSVQDLARIRHVLKPTVLELANLFGVSRQTVYDWQSGSQPSAQTSARLADLASAADVFAKAGVTVNTQTLRRKIAGGATLLDAVLNGDNATELAQSLVGTLQREDSQRERLAQLLAGRKREPINLSDYGAPSPAEDA